MRHTGDYELDEINMLEQECADLEEDNKRLEQENKKLENKIHKLGIRIYQNIDGEKRKEYQEYCKRHRL